MPGLTLPAIRDILDRMDARLYDHVEAMFDGKVATYRVMPDVAYEALFELRLALDREILRQSEGATWPELVARELDKRDRTRG